MTTEDLQEIVTLNKKVNSLKTLFLYDGTIDKENINYLLKFDDGFKVEFHKLRQKYFNRYKEEFEKIIINK